MLGFFTVCRILPKFKDFLLKSFNVKGTNLSTFQGFIEVKTQGVFKTVRTLIGVDIDVLPVHILPFPW